MRASGRRKSCPCDTRLRVSPQLRLFRTSFFGDRTPTLASRTKMPTASLSPSLNRKYSERPSTVRLTVVRNRTRLSLHTSDDSANTADSEQAATGSYCVMIPSSPISLSAASRHRGSGIKFLAFSLLAFGTAGFIGYELPKTPTLSTQMIVLIAICTLAGIAMLHLALGKLWGCLRVDARGVRWTPSYAGFDFAWKDLRSWNADHLSFHFRTRKAAHAYSIDRELFSIDDQNRLLAMLSACVGQRENRTAG